MLGDIIVTVMISIIQIIYVDGWFHVSCALPMQSQAINYHFDRKLTITSSFLAVVKNTRRKNGETNNIYVKTKVDLFILIPQL